MKRPHFWGESSAKMESNGLLVLVTLFSFGLLQIQGNITISLEPSYCSKTDSCKLVCTIDKMTERVLWKHKGTTLFTCNPPYGAGICSSKSNSDGFEGEIDGHRLIAIFGSMSKIITSDYMCFHGDENATLDTQLQVSATIPTFSFTPSKPPPGADVTLTCRISTDLPVDVSMTVTDINNQEQILYTQKNSSQKSFTTKTKFECGSDVIKCTVWNQWGQPKSSSKVIPGACPIQILYDQINQTVEGEIGSDIELRLYYTGYPAPEVTWYKRNQNTEIKLNGYRNSQAQNTKSVDHEAYALMTINGLRMEDGGQYTAHVMRDTEIKIVPFTVYVKDNLTDTGTTSSPEIAEEQSSDLGIGIGIGIAISVGIALICGIIFVIIKKYRNRRQVVQNVRELHQAKESEADRRKETTFRTDNEGFNRDSVGDDYDDLEEIRKTYDYEKV